MVETATILLSLRFCRSGTRAHGGQLVSSPLRLTRLLHSQEMLQWRQLGRMPGVLLWGSLPSPWAGVLASPPCGLRACPPHATFTPGLLITGLLKHSKWRRENTQRRRRKLPDFIRPGHGSPDVSSSPSVEADGRHAQTLGKGNKQSPYMLLTSELCLLRSQELSHLCIISLCASPVMTTIHSLIPL